jgi:dGTPase
MYRDSDWHRPLADSGPQYPYRTEARRDLARITHCPAFRRLQGKTQLFPGIDSDYFRNRLTHSLEVAQVAESICYKLNFEQPELKEAPINPDVVRLAGLAHDLGHPPFGHNGELALDEAMRATGGFEGNAQTLRILSTLEKKFHSNDTEYGIGVTSGGIDQRFGLNLTFRSLASVIKYDAPIKLIRRSAGKLAKGYYESDRALVDQIKNAVCGDSKIKRKKFKTIECQIMDIADDIAYSTYDIDDAFKAGFLSPLDVLSSSPVLLKRVASNVNKRLGLSGGEQIDDGKALDCLVELFEPSLRIKADTKDEFLVFQKYEVSKLVAGVGYLRTQLTSEFITRFLKGIQFEYDGECPALSRVFLERETEILVETLKVFSFEATIMSSRLKISEHRGKEIVTTIFECLDRDDGHHLLPDDFREIFERFGTDEASRRRVICDFVAGMTDRYAVEFYSRLVGESPKSVFNPL